MIYLPAIRDRFLKFIENYVQKIICIEETLQQNMTALIEFLAGMGYAIDATSPTIKNDIMSSLQHILTVFKPAQMQKSF